MMKWYISTCHKYQISNFPVRIADKNSGLRHCFGPDLLLTDPSAVLISFFYLLPPPCAPVLTQSCNNCFFVCLCVCFMSVLLCIKTHVSMRNGKPVGSPSCHSLFSSFGQTEEGQYGNSFQAQTLQIFFQIAYLLFKLYQSKFTWVPGPLESPLMPSRAISVSVQIAASLSSGLSRFDSVSQDCNVLLSPAAKKLKIEVKSYSAPGTEGRIT